MKHIILAVTALAMITPIGLRADEPLKDPLQAKGKVTADIADIRQATIGTMTTEGYSLSEELDDMSLYGNIQSHWMTFTAKVRSPNNPQVECLFTARFIMAEHSPPELTSETDMAIILTRDWFFRGGNDDTLRQDWPRAHAKGFLIRLN